MQRTLWDGVENRCQNKKLGRFVFLLYCGWGFKISIWTGNSLDLVECRVRSHRGPGDLVIPRPVLFLGTLWSQGMLGAQGQSGEWEVGWKRALQLYHFPQTFIAFPSSFIQRVLHDFSMPGILLGIWDLKMNTGEFLLVRSLDKISNTDQRNPFPLGGGLCGPTFL